MSSLHVTLLQSLGGALASGRGGFAKRSAREVEDMLLGCRAGGLGLLKLELLGVEDSRCFGDGGWCAGGGLLDMAKSRQL